MRILTSLFAATACAGLTACGGGGGSAPTPAMAPTDTQFAAILADDRAEIARIAAPGTGIPTTLPGNVPTTNPSSGMASFDGVGIAAIDISATRGVLIRGNAGVDVDFANDTLSGEVTDLVAVDSQNGTPVLVSNDISLTNGQFVPGLRNAFTVDYDGTLDVGGTDYVLDGDMNGQFRGTNAQALSITDDSNATTSNGTTLRTQFSIVAEQ